jgi:hypothetical protein
MWSSIRHRVGRENLDIMVNMSCLQMSLRALYSHSSTISLDCFVEALIDQFTSSPPLPPVPPISTLPPTSSPGYLRFRHFPRFGHLLHLHHFLRCVRLSRFSHASSRALCFSFAFGASALELANNIGTERQPKLQCQVKLLNFSYPLILTI